MRLTFNCGIGMAIIVNANEADAICQMLSATGNSAHVIGSIESGSNDTPEVAYR